MNERTDRKEYMKKWQQDNKEKTRENAKRYYYKNIDKIKEKRQSNEYKEKYREYKKEWARKNRKMQKEIINNLQSKIDKANEYIEERFTFDDKNGEYYQTHTFDKDNAKELHDILKEEI
jgi:hypothetical protein